MIEQIIQTLHSLEDERTKKRYLKINEQMPYIGVPMGELRKMAKMYKQHSHLFMPLWRTKLLELQYLAILIGKANQLSSHDIDECLAGHVSLNVLDKFNDVILAKRNDAQMWKQTLKQSSSLYHQRLAWSLEAHHLRLKQVTSEELSVIFDTIANQLVHVNEVVQWTMNRCLVELAVNYPEWLDKCRHLAEQLGVYRDMVVAKGCTSAYAPEWIDALLKNRKIK